MAQLLTSGPSANTVLHMLRIVFMGLLLAALVSPAWAGDSESFDPRQPFTQALSQRLLKSFLSQALAVLDEHIEISGSVNQDSSKGDRTQRLQFKFYPEGKSKSDEHITAEGWVGPSGDSRQEEFHFRFALPKPSTSEPTPNQFDQVL
jgi:hypothetical protein